MDAVGNGMYANKSKQHAAEPENGHQREAPSVPTGTRTHVDQHGVNRPRHDSRGNFWVGQPSSITTRHADEDKAQNNRYREDEEGNTDLVRHEAVKRFKRGKSGQGRDSFTFKVVILQNVGQGENARQAEKGIAHKSGEYMQSEPYILNCRSFDRAGIAG